MSVRDMTGGISAMPIDSYTSRFQLLKEKGYIQASRVSGPFRSKVRNLIDMGILEFRHKGRGRILAVVDKASFEAYLKREYPRGLVPLEEELSGRTRGILETRDSKKGGRTSAALIHLKGSKGVVLRREEKRLDVGKLTQISGVAGLLLDGKRPWRFRGILVTIENLEVFLHCEDLFQEGDLFIYTSGVIDERLIEWVASEEMGQCSVIHAGDYDPRGLWDYIRLRKKLGGRVELFIPENLEELVRKYGNKDILGKSTKLLPKVRKEGDEAVKKVIDILDRHGRGLEQEVLLVGKGGEE